MSVADCLVGLLDERLYNRVVAVTPSPRPGRRWKRHAASLVRAQLAGYKVRRPCGGSSGATRTQWEGGLLLARATVGGGLGLVSSWRTGHLSGERRQILMLPRRASGQARVRL